MQATCVLDADNYLGESPVWSVDAQALWWVNCEHPAEILRWVPSTQALNRWPMPQRIGGLATKADGGLVVALADGIYDFDAVRGTVTLRAASPLPAHVTLHECHCDRHGRFWVGAFDHRFPADRSAAGGAFFRLDNQVLTPVIEGIAVANGLAFSADGRTMFAASTPQRTVKAFDIDPRSGALSNERIFLSLPSGDGHIDGATVDAEGGYWLAVVARGVIRRYLPDGALDREITLPCANPTKPAFGGRSMETLFVTSTQMRIGPDGPGSAANGGLFSLSPGVKGVAEAHFAG
ncbi:SMP-30/gluconolactonase/LRE family protein [Sphingomonas sp. SUN039]|uniref:SMP-30/gluconolactonase/LRE family protein n=1 Tax=Sphingomonas sp. SUN039 TaxID=2937787 RepID=UPI0021640E15|nr:SMP-30/gluconolactonase/LRE family protein [Sphingomonas sp. SUN039]UVO55849.1 SMP-30/gluconolactonase/LRE family protein [Sphingomonas sp. SUN039]